MGVVSGAVTASHTLERLELQPQACKAAMQPQASRWQVICAHAAREATVADPRTLSQEKETLRSAAAALRLDAVDPGVRSADLGLAAIVRCAGGGV